MNGEHPPDPLHEYTRRLAERRERARAQARRTALLSHARFATFVVAVALAVALWAGLLGGGGALAIPPFAAFVGAVVLHQRSRQVQERAERAVAFYERGLARLRYESDDARWTQREFAAAEHPYAEHLDLFGPHSLFARLCHAQTRGGAERLASWLLEPAAPAEIAARQEAARELRGYLDLREDRAVAAPLHPGGLSAEWLVAWGREARLAPSGALRVGLGLLSGIALATAGSALLGLTGWGPFLIVAAVESGLYWTQRARVHALGQAVERPARELGRLAELLERFERADFQAPRLRELRARAEHRGRPPSVEIARLLRLVEWLELRRNQLFAVLLPAVLWGTQFALAIEAWRAEHGAELQDWFDTLFELEALLDLGGYAYEHPGDPFPEIAGAAGVASDPGAAPGSRGAGANGAGAGEVRAVYSARGLGHPLIPEPRCVRNDLDLGPGCALLVVSGSNMSGKSTWLRSVGTNAVLALAGAPVRAEQLRISPLWIGASIRVQDSLEEGVSRFYAEIRCLARVAKLAEEQPVLFLLDEVLAGTNSHDRGIGAAGLVRALLARGALGLLTTHDLALARIADELAPRAANVHFEDHLEDGEVRFDYQMREGVVARSNALALMRAVGLSGV